MSVDKPLLFQESPVENGLDVGYLKPLKHFWEDVNDRVCCWFATAEKGALEFVRQYKAIFLMLMLLQIAAYSYFYTSITFNNHTLPNTWLYPYPSNKTNGEGRWLADFIILAQGGSGVQSFQMICATLLQAFNGIMLAILLGINGKRTLFCIAAVLCLYPAFLDYYAFAADHLTFVLGDSLALLGAISFIKKQVLWERIAGAALFWLLAIACYQPKISLVSFLASGTLLLLLVKPTVTMADISPQRQAIKDVLSVGLALLIAVVGYWLTTKLVITKDLGIRTHLNSLGEVKDQILAVYPTIFAHFTQGTNGIPPSLQWLPAVGIMLGITSVLFNASRKNVVVFLLALIIIALMPITLQASYVINKASWQDTGRIVAASGYFFVFFLGYGTRINALKGLSTGIAMVCLYFFMVLATQQSNAATLKTIYEINLINRIAARAEVILGTQLEPSWALVVAGHYPEFELDKYIRHPNGMDNTHFQTIAFEIYRQPEILNFFMGRKIFRQATQDEMAVVLKSMQNKPSWPASESVYRVNNTLVVLLEPYSPNIPVTWTVDKI